MKSISIIFFIAILCFLSNCTLSDSTEELGSGYQFVHEGKDDNFINGSHSIPANVIAYAYNDDFIIVEQRPQKESYRDFLSSDFMTRYLIYTNQLKDSLFLKKNTSEHLRNKVQSDSNIYKIFLQKGISINNTLSDIAKCHEIVDSILNNDITYHELFLFKQIFWIISNKHDILIGPLTEEEYLKKRVELKVPNDLKLKPVE